LPRERPDGSILVVPHPPEPTAMSSDLEALLQEHRKFEPPEAFRAAALISSPDVYERAAADPEA
jgi:hypothetical protein